MKNLESRFFYAELYGDGWDGQAVNVLCFGDVIDAIEQQPKVGEWIPCSERLPELYRVDMESEGEYYMISDSVIITDGERASISEYEIDDEDCRGWFAHDFEEIEDVIAWMPIPEPYRQGEEE